MSRGLKSSLAKSFRSPSPVKIMPPEKTLNVDDEKALQQAVTTKPGAPAPEADLAVQDVTPRSQAPGETPRHDRSPRSRTPSPPEGEEVVKPVDDVKALEAEPAVEDFTDSAAAGVMAGMGAP